MQLAFATSQGAAESAQLPILQFLYAKGIFLDPMACEVAARRGDFVTLRWLREHECGWHTNLVLPVAASSGNTKMMAWIIKQPGIVPNAGIIAAAARMGHTAMCEYLHAEHFPWNVSACTSAASSGHVGTLRWLHEHDCPWSAARTCEAAAAGGSIAAIEYVLQQGLVFTPELLTVTLNAAGAHNKLAAAQWMRQQGAEWPSVLRAHDTVWSGDTLAWARAEGCTSPAK
jgi:hypothetical protein